jgi:hypothetical protein
MSEAIYQSMSKDLGKSTTPITYDVEKGHVKRFAEAIGDDNPQWRGVTTPPTFIRAFIPSDEDESRPRDPGIRVLDGGSEYEYFKAIRPGDRISVVSKIADVFKKEGRLGTMTFQVKEISFTNQDGDVVATRRDTGIYY